MSTLTAKRKAMRGTKRTCLACEVRFYDLGRSPMVCPSCGAHHTPAAEPAVPMKAPVTPFVLKTEWRAHPFKRPQPLPPIADLEGSRPSEAITGEVDETATSISEDATVLDQETENEDVSELIEHDVAEPFGNDVVR
jgi:hypothetical protein